jgi:hypothetical protein
MPLKLMRSAITDFPKPSFPLHNYRKQSLVSRSQAVAVVFATWSFRNAECFEQYPNGPPAR